MLRNKNFSFLCDRYISLLSYPKITKITAVIFLDAQFYKIHSTSVDQYEKNAVIKMKMVVLNMVQYLQTILKISPNLITN